MNLRHVAIYTRVSSDHQAATHTIASQVAWLRECAALDELVLPEAMQFLDEGYSGATSVRPRRWSDSAMSSPQEPSTASMSTHQIGWPVNTPIRSY
jgi:hypothetical protein